MPDYAKAKIYAIKAPGCDDIYIGSTCNLLCVRMGAHRYGYKKWSQDPESHRYTTSFKVLEKPGAYIELIENFPCESIEELNRREGELIRITLNCINANIPGRDRSESLKEYHQANKDSINEKQRMRWFLKKKYAFLD